MIVDLEMTTKIVDDVALFLHGLLQRGRKLPLDQIKEESGAYQLEMGNNWRLFHIEDDTWRLWSRYEDQELIDHILAVTCWHFSIKPNSENYTEKGKCGTPLNPNLGSSFDDFLTAEGIKNEVDEKAAKEVATWLHNKATKKKTEG